MDNISPAPVDEVTITEQVSALRLRQPIGDVYIARMTSDQIQKVTFFDVRRRIQAERDIERYLGIQRPLDPKRVVSLKQYVNFADATFPTAIIIAVDSEYAEYDETLSRLTLSNTRKDSDKPDTAIKGLCRVIDGQHRIAGLEGFAGQHFEVLVSIFVGSDIADQAYVFATVNLEQNKVNRSLAYDLYELAHVRSPYKTCHNITVALDRATQSPFFHRIKRLGVSTGPDRPMEFLTQATVVNSLVQYITNDPKIDRDLLLKGKKLEKPSGKDAKKLFLRGLFIDDNDLKIGKIIEEYFKAVRQRWPEAWDFAGAGLMLNRTNGFRALMRLFEKMYLYFGAPGDLITADQYLELFQRVQADSQYFSVERFKPGTSGEAALRRMLDESIFGQTSLL